MYIEFMPLGGHEYIHRSHAHKKVESKEIDVQTFRWSRINTKKCFVGNHVFFKSAKCACTHTYINININICTGRLSLLTHLKPQQGMGHVRSPEQLK